MFVEESIADKFLEMLVDRVSKMVIGDPFNSDTTVGATISQAQADKVMHYINVAKKEVK